MMMDILLGAGHDEDKGGEGGDAQHQEDLVPQPAQLPQAGVLPVQHLIICPHMCFHSICVFSNLSRMSLLKNS